MNGTVTLNDPGNPDDGKMYVMSREDFLEAWDDSGYAMVVTDVAPGDQPQGDAGAAAPTAGQIAPTSGELGKAGFVILPVVVAADVLRRKVVRRP